MTLAIPGPDRAERLGLFRSVLYPVDEAVDEEIRLARLVSPALPEDAHPDPGAFRPERFPGQPGSTYTWISFGERVCRGLGASFALMEMRGVLQALARRGELHPLRPERERVIRQRSRPHRADGASARRSVVARSSPYE